MFLIIFLICVHLKKDGTLDMRYKSSKQLKSHSSNYEFKERDFHYKKDGTLDLRYKSSKAYLGAGGSAYKTKNDE